MLDGYVLHFPLTDFAVSLLVVAAVVEVLRLVLKRDAWTTAVDVLLVAGFLGVLAAVGSGLWLVAVQEHEHDDLLTIHHWFAYGTLAVASATMLARSLQKRVRAFAAVKTGLLVVSAALVSGAGLFGGKMAHPASDTAHEEEVHHDDAGAGHSNHRLR